MGIVSSMSERQGGVTWLSTYIFIQVPGIKYYSYGDCGWFCFPGQPEGKSAVKIELTHRYDIIDMCSVSVAKWPNSSSANDNSSGTVVTAPIATLIPKKLGGCLKKKAECNHLSMNCGMWQCTGCGNVLETFRKGS